MYECPKCGSENFIAVYPIRVKFPFAKDEPDGEYYYTGSSYAESETVEVECADCGCVTKLTNKKTLREFVEDISNMENVPVFEMRI